MSKKIFVLCFLLIASQVSGQTPGTLKWESAYYDLQHGPVISRDGTLYAVGWATFLTDSLHAFNPDGTLKWEYKVSDPLSHKFLGIGEDNSIYIFVGKTLVAVGPDGTKKWSYIIPSIYTPYLTCDPAIASDGTIYVVDSFVYLYAINPDGTEKWMCDPHYDVGTPVIGHDGTIYIGCYTRMWAIDPADGSEIWEYDLDAGFELYSEYWVKPGLVIGSDGTLYFGTYTDSFDEKRFYAINPDGSTKWVFTVLDSKLDWHYFCVPVIGTDGTIYVVASDKKLYALNPDGTKKWECLIGSIIKNPLLVGNDGTIYAVSESYSLYAISPSGVIKWAGMSGGDSNSPISMDSNGAICSLYGGKLIAVYSDSTDLADSSWPMYQHDTRHTGRVGADIVPLNHVIIVILLMGIPVYYVIRFKNG